MKNTVLPPEIPQQLVEAIQHRLGACSIYCFGYRQAVVEAPGHHFYLLVFAAKADGAAGVNIANALAGKSGRGITATILVHSIHDLHNARPHMQHFFDGVFRNALRLSLNKSAVPYLTVSQPVTDLEADKAFWLKCEAVAQFNLYAAANHPYESVGLCKITLLHTAVQQVALALLRTFLSYTPNEHSLRFLLELCGQFTSLPTEAFPNQTAKEQTLYKMLCAPPSLLRHRIHLQTPEADFQHLLTATETFITKASELINKERVQ